MIDYFALLQQPRKPWLEPEELKQQYQDLAKATHPDRPDAKDKEADDSFAALNEAYRVLSAPALRLRHLLTLEGSHPGAHQLAPEELMGLFTEIGGGVQDVDQLLGKLKHTNNALSRSLLQKEILEAQKRIAELLDRLRNSYDNAIQELKALNEVWNEQSAQTMTRVATLYQRFAYLTRWIAQLEERQFQLTN